LGAADDVTGPCGFAFDNPWSVGDKVYVQAWFRDPLDVKSTNLSNALEMTYVP
jgi:hypothetical protein